MIEIAQQILESDEPLTLVDLWILRQAGLLK